MRGLFTIAAAAAALLACATPALARQADQQPQAEPLVVERIQNGWLFSPDMRAADLGGETGALAGGYAGRLYDNTFVFGGGAYFLTNRDDDFKLAYGGPVVEWLARTNRRIGFGVRALVGFGAATLPVPVTEIVDERVLASASRRHRVRFDLLDPTGTIAIDDGFFIAEPQANLHVNVARGQRIVFGVGYRATAGAHLIDDQLNGLSGSISYQIGK
jgi:opacity protein-like surface antigen